MTAANPPPAGGGKIQREVIVREGAGRSRGYNPLSFLGIVAGTLGIIGLTFWINCLFNVFHVHDSNPRVNFEAFANAVGENYAFFDLRGVDWANVTAQYEHRVSDGTSEDSLFEFFCEMYKPLQDPDTYLIKIPSRKEGIEGIGVDVEDQIERICVSAERHEVTKSESAAIELVDSLPLLHAINDRYLGGKGTFLEGSDSSLKMLYGMIGHDIGYINILTMGGYSVIGNDEQVVRQMLDDILEEFQCPSGGIILDVRFNTGGQWSESTDINNLSRFRGYDAVSRAIVSHFVESKQLLYMSQTRVPGTEEYSDLTEFYADADTSGKDGHSSYIGPVALLQSRGTFSAADVFTLAMQTLPNVTSIGTRSAGYYSGVLSGNLPNGWWYGLSNQRYYNFEGTIYEGKGTPVDITVSPAVNTSGIVRGHDEPMSVALRVLRDGNANIRAQCFLKNVSGGVTAMLVLSGLVILVVISTVLWPSCYRRQKMVRVVVAFSCVAVLVFTVAAELLDMPRLALPVIMIVALPMSIMQRWRCCNKKSRKSFHAGRMLLQVCALGLWVLTWPVAVLAVVEPISGMGAFAGISASISIALFAADFHFRQERDGSGGGEGGADGTKGGSDGEDDDDAGAHKKTDYFMCSSFEDDPDDDDDFSRGSFAYARRAALHCNRAAGGPGTMLFGLAIAVLSVFVISLALGAEMSYTPDSSVNGENYEVFIFPKAPLLFAAVIISTTTIVVLEGMNSSTSCRWLCCDCVRRHPWLPYRCGAYHRALFYQSLSWLSCIVAQACFLVTSIRGLVYSKAPVPGAMAMIGVCGVSAMVCMAISVYVRVHTLRSHSPRQVKNKPMILSAADDVDTRSARMAPLSALTINSLWASETAGVQRQLEQEITEVDMDMDFSRGGNEQHGEEGLEGAEFASNRHRVDRRPATEV